MKAVPQLAIALGDETEAEGHAFVSKQGGAPLGSVTVEFQGMGALLISSTDPEPLRVVEEAFRAARYRLLTLIAENSASETPRSGADVLDEADRPAEGEQPSPRPAAPPSNPEHPEHGSKFDRSMSELDAGL